MRVVVLLSEEKRDDPLVVIGEWSPGSSCVQFGFCVGPKDGRR